MTVHTRDIAQDTAHRPWPLPDGAWLMFQSWRDLLFMHWPVSAAALRPLVPAPITIDVHGGTAWIGITPFRVDGLRVHMLPALPGISSFPELNVRTYVTYGGRPGVWFFSLDTSSRLAVLGARAGYRLPYHAAGIDLRNEADGWHRCTSSRDVAPADIPAQLDVRYRAAGDGRRAGPGSLEHFLTERYALYVLGSDGSVRRGDIHHAPWTLQPAEAEILRNTMTAPLGLALPEHGPKLHYAARQDTLIWPLRNA